MSSEKGLTLAALTLVALASWAAAPCSAGTGRDLVSRGNRAYAQGDYDGALEAYDKASVDLPESPQIQFNKAAAHYMKGEYEQASELFQQSAIKSEAVALEAASLFNQGNCSFRESERQRDSDLEKSVKALEQSIVQYQKALELDPELNDAAHNIEVARLTMKQLLDELKKQQEQAQQQQQKADRLKELIKRQEELLASTRALSDEKDQAGQTSFVQQQGQRLAEDQKSLKEDTASLAKEMEDPQAAQGAQPPTGMQSASSPADTAKEHLDRAVSQQNKAEYELWNSSLGDAKGSEEKAVEEMKKALESMGGGQGRQQGENQQQDQQQDQQQQDEQQQGQEPQQEPKDQQQQAASRVDEDAHDILDEERQEREQRRIRTSGGLRAVDKDW